MGRDGKRFADEPRSLTELARDRRQAFHRGAWNRLHGILGTEIPRDPRYWVDETLGLIIASISKIFMSGTLERLLSAKGWNLSAVMQKGVIREPGDISPAEYPIGNVKIKRVDKTAPWCKYTPLDPDPFHHFSCTWTPNQWQGSTSLSGYPR